jgi:hypothetical protein
MSTDTTYLHPFTAAHEHTLRRCGVCDRRFKLDGPLAVLPTKDGPVTVHWDCRTEVKR